MQGKRRQYQVDLRGWVTIVALGEEDVIILVAFERRVKMDKANRFVFDIAAEYFIDTD
jgi:hypothetical protein